MKPQILLVAVLALSVLACKPQSNVSNINATSANRNESSATAGSQSKPCVNLNTATAKELISLEGIGEVIAQRIIDYRERNGRFRRKEDILIIEGVSEKKYHAIADKICVD